jgi:hypothetical protein
MSTGVNSPHPPRAKKEVIFLDESPVEVLVSDAAAADAISLEPEDAGLAEGLLYSLIAPLEGNARVKSQLRSCRGVLDMLRSLFLDSGSRSRSSSFKARTIAGWEGRPIVLASRRVAWPGLGPRSMTDAEFLVNLSDLRRKLGSVQAIDEFYRPLLAADPTQSKTIRRSESFLPIDAHIPGYGPLMRLLPGDPFMVRGVSLVRSVAASKGSRRTLDQDAESLDLSQVTNVQDLWNLPRPNLQHPGLSIILDPRVAWTDAVAWALPPVEVAAARESKGDATPQEILDRIGWNEQVPVKAHEFARLAAICASASARLAAQGSQGPSGIPGVPESSSTESPESSSTESPESKLLLDAWNSAHRLSGYLVILDGLEVNDATKLKTSKTRVQPPVGEAPECLHRGAKAKTLKSCESSKKETPGTVIARFAGGSPDDGEIQRCDRVTFVDVGGLEGVSLTMDVQEVESLNLRIMTSTGLQKPSPDCLLKLFWQQQQKQQHLGPDSSSGLDDGIEDFHENPRDSAERVKAYIRGLEAAGRQRTGLVWTEIQNKFVVSKPADGVNKNSYGVGDETQELELSYQDDAAYRVYRQQVDVGSSRKSSTGHGQNWEYGVYLNLLLVALNLSRDISQGAESFILKNVTFVNPVEVFLGKLRRAIQALKSRHQQNAARWREGPKKYRLHEEMLIAKMRKDVLAVFVVRTLTACAALLLLGMEQKSISSTATPWTRDEMAAIIKDILVDGLALQSNEELVKKLLEDFEARFRAEGKKFPMDPLGLISSAPRRSPGVPPGGRPSPRGKNIRRLNVNDDNKSNVESIWPGFRPVPVRSSPGTERGVLSRIELVVSASSSDLKNFNNFNFNFNNNNNNNRLKLNRSNQHACCQAKSREAPFFFLRQDDGLASIVKRERDAAQEQDAAWRAETGARPLLGFMVGIKTSKPAVSLSTTVDSVESERLSLVGTEQQLDALPILARYRQSVPDTCHGLDEDLGNASSWADSVLTAGPKRLAQSLNRFQQRVKHLHKTTHALSRSIERLIAEHRASSDSGTGTEAAVEILHRLMRGTIPAILQRHGVRLNPRALPPVLQDHGLLILAMLLTFLLDLIDDLMKLPAAKSTLLADVLGEIHRAIDFNLVDEAGLQKDLQKQREEEKVRKLDAANRMTDEERDLLQEFRKFRSDITWPEVQALLGRDAAGPDPGRPTRDDVQPGLLQDVVQEEELLSQGALGGLDRDEDVPEDLEYVPQDRE